MEQKTLSTVAMMTRHHAMRPRAFCGTARHPGGAGRSRFRRGPYRLLHFFRADSVQDFDAAGVSMTGGGATRPSQKHKSRLNLSHYPSNNGRNSHAKSAKHSCLDRSFF
jgi:hypothetical protein